MEEGAPGEKTSDEDGAPLFRIMDEGSSGV